MSAVRPVVVVLKLVRLEFLSLLSFLEGISQACDRAGYSVGSLLEGVTVAQRCNVFEAVDHVVRHPFQEVWLVL